MVQGRERKSSGKLSAAARRLKYQLARGEITDFEYQQATKYIAPKSLSKSERDAQYDRLTAPDPRRDERYRRWLERRGAAVPFRIGHALFWICRRAGFNPLDDRHWEWWTIEIDQHSRLELYRLGMIERALSRTLKKKKNPDREIEIRSVWTDREVIQTSK